MGRRIGRISLGDVLSHGYIWLCLLVFVTPFLVLFAYSFSTPGGSYAVDNFQYVFGSFLDNLKWSFIISGLTLVGNVAIALPAAYALMRYSDPGQAPALHRGHAAAVRAGRGHRPLAAAGLLLHVPPRHVDVGPRVRDDDRAPSR